MTTQQEKDLDYNDLLTRHHELIKQNEQLTQLQINQRQEIYTLTSELQSCKKVKKEALTAKQKAEAKQEASAQQVLSLKIQINKTISKTKEVSEQYELLKVKYDQVVLEKEKLSNKLKERQERTKTVCSLARIKIEKLEKKIKDMEANNA